MAAEALFEGPSPLARRLAAEGPWEDERTMIARAYELLPELSEEERIATVNAHPRIGEDPAKLSRHSLAEQAADRRPELERLNTEYEARFGFRFVIFVDGRTKAEVAEVLKERMRNPRQAELDTALKAVVDIAASRVGR